MQNKIRNKPANQNSLPSRPAELSRERERRLTHWLWVPAARRQMKQLATLSDCSFSPLSVHLLLLHLLLTTSDPPAQIGKAIGVNGLKKKERTHVGKRKALYCLSFWKLEVSYTRVPVGLCCPFAGLVHLLPGERMNRHRSPHPSTQILSKLSVYSRLCHRIHLLSKKPIMLCWSSNLF